MSESKPRVLIADGMDIETFRKILGDGFSVDYLPGISHEELKTAGKTDALIVKPRSRVDRDVLAACSPRFVGIAGSGTENVDMDFARERGIRVKSLPMESVESVAEYTLTMLGNLARGIVRANESLKAMRWEKERFHGTGLKGKVLGLVGVGRIGRAVALRAARGFGMEVIGHDPYVRQEDLGGLECGMVGMEELLRRADFISVHAPLSGETEGLFGGEELGRMKDGVFIVNTSRARLFRRESLVEALRSGKVGGYATDVHYCEPAGGEDRDLLGLEGVICTPHIGAQTLDVQRSLAEKMALLLKEGLAR